MTLYFRVDEVKYLPYDQILLTANFERSFLQVKQAMLGSTSTIANNGSILYVAYSLKMISKGQYPNVSFNIRRFQGWNEGSCKFGGYLIVEAKYYLTNGGNYKLGPFCSKSFSTEPFVGTHGPKNIIFGKHEIYIILYAFGPMYSLDIDLVVLPSECEGIFELPYSCLHSSRTSQYVANHDNHNYRVKCSKVILRHELLSSQLIFDIVVKCIIIQGIGYSQLEIEHYEILSTADVKVKVTQALPFLPLGETYGISNASLSLYGDKTEVYNITHLNSSFQTTAHNIELLKFRIYKFYTHHRFTYSIYVNASVQYGMTCSNSSGIKDHVGIIMGKLYHIITIINICGSMLLKSTGVSIFRFRLKPSNFQEDITYVEITKNDSNGDSISDKQDTLTLAYEGRGVSHTVKFTPQMIRLDIHKSFGLIVEKSKSNVTLILRYRIERFKVYSKIGYMLVTDNLKDNVITVSNKYAITIIVFLHCLPIYCFETYNHPLSNCG